MHWEARSISGSKKGRTKRKEIETFVFSSNYNRGVELSIEIQVTYCIDIQMRQQLSRERLNQLHEALDRELESIDQLHLVAPPSVSITASSKAVPKTSNLELEDLQKKLIHLEKKMEKINLSSEEEDEQSFEMKKVSKPASVQNSIKKPKQPNRLEREEEVPSQKSIKQRSTMKSGKKKTIEVDLDDSPLKRKYQLDSANKHSPKAKIKKPEKSVDKSYKDNPLSLSRKSMDQMSVRSTKSLNKNLTSAQQYSRIQQLQQDLRRYRQQNKKLKTRVKGLQAMQIKYQKLKQNFEKSETIRKQQKIVIQGYKNKLKAND